MDLGEWRLKGSKINSEGLYRTIKTELILEFTQRNKIRNQSPVLLLDYNFLLIFSS